MPQGSPAGDYRIEIPSKSREGMRCVFTVGDLVAPNVKDAVPDWKLGGILRPGVLTLSHVNGYIQRCKIVDLRQHMEAEAASNVMPSERAHKTRDYQIIEHGEARTIGRDKNNEPDGLLRTAFYPVDEVGRLCGQNDGIVEMPCTNGEQIRIAQDFLFPHWNDFLTGRKAFPPKIASLKVYFQSRLKFAQDAGNDWFVAIAKAAIRSCDQYEAWGRDHVKDQHKMLAEAEAKGAPFVYGDMTELVFSQLSIARKDNLIQETADRQANLEQSIAKQAESIASLADALRQNQVNQMAAAYVGAPPPPATTVVAEEDGLKEAVNETVACKALTNQGARCKNVAEPNGYCKMPQHQAKAEEEIAAEAEAMLKAAEEDAH